MTLLGRKDLAAARSRRRSLGQSPAPAADERVTSCNPPNADLAARMRTVADRVLEIAPDVTVYFVTNLQNGAVADVGPDGILNTAQYYTRAQAEEIIRSLQSLGVTVRSFFDERAFLEAVSTERNDGDRHVVVFTTAEGGAGSGRRALIPAVCNLFGLPVLNSGAHACSVARHKLHANAVLQHVGVRVPAAWQFARGGWTGERRPPDGTRVIIKPTYESMCVGIDDESVQIVDGGFDAIAAAKAESFRQPVVVQEFISGEEVGVPVVRLHRTMALPAIAFRRRDGSLYGSNPKTFRDENLAHDTSRALYRAEPAQYAALQRSAVLAFDALEMQGVGRIDLRVDVDGRAWAFDTNESPPPLGGTAYAAAMQELGFTVSEMLAVWLGVCLVDHGIISGV